MKMLEIVSAQRRPVERRFQLPIVRRLRQCAKLARFFDGEWHETTRNHASHFGSALSVQPLAFRHSALLQRNRPLEYWNVALS